MISKTLKDIALLVEGDVFGDNVTIIGLNGIKEAKSGDLTFLADRKHLPLLSQTKASAIIVAHDMKEDVSAFPHIRVKDPSAAFSKIVNTFSSKEHYVERGIHATAVIGEQVRLGQNVAIGPHVVIQKGARIGDDTVIHAGCFIGFQTQIGVDCEIYPNVTIRERIVIGSRVIVHSGAVLGADGFGYQTIDGKHVKIPQAGIIRVEDDVEIGANVTIDRARLHETVIGAGTKIDNLVQIGHNVIIGKNCLILSLAGISGSVVIEDDVIIAGQVGVAGHIRIGKGAMVAAQTGIMRDVELGAKMFGTPAKPHMLMKRIDVCMESLPETTLTVKNLVKKIQQLEEDLQKLKAK